MLCWVFLKQNKVKDSIFMVIDRFLKWLTLLHVINLMIYLISELAFQRNREIAWHAKDHRF